MAEESMLSGVESSGVDSTAGAGGPAGASRPWLSSKGILMLLCVFLISLCCIIALVIYLIMLKSKQLPGGGKAVPEPDDR